MGTLAGSEETVGLDQAKKHMPPRPYGSRADRMSLGAPRPRVGVFPLPCCVGLEGLMPITWFSRLCKCP